MRHGFYWRCLKAETGEIYSIKIQRVRCRACDGSHALLYDFLIPYRLPTVQAMSCVISAYLQEANTYLHVLNEAVTEVASAFGALESALKHLPMAYMFLMQLLVAGEMPREIARHFSCPNSHKASKEGKAEKLDWLAALVKMRPDIFEILNRHGFAMFASGRGCGLLRTHRTECPLF